MRYIRRTSGPAFHLLVIVLAAGTLPLRGQDQPADTSGPWSEGAKVAVNFTQVALSNWAGGGENTIAVGSMGAAFATFEGENAHWDTRFELGYGFAKVEDQEFRKSDDRVILISKASHEETERLLYSALLDFRTQLTNGYDYDEMDELTGEPQLISAPFAPAYLNLGLGMTWKPVNYFEFFAGPLAHHLIIVLNDTLSEQGMFGVEPGERVKNELGILSNLKFGKEVFENVRLTSRLNLFAPYETLDKVVVTWESALSMKVNSWLSVDVTADIVYDEKVKIARDDGSIGPATQFRNTLTVGVGYTF